MQVGTNPITVRHSISHVARGAARAGRRLEEVELVLSTFAVVSGDRADDVRRVRPLASFFYSVTPHLLDLAGVRYQRRFPERMPHPDLTHAYDWDEAMAAAATYISDEAVDQFCLVGPPERAIERLRALASLGIRQFFLRWSSTYWYTPSVRASSPPWRAPSRRPEDGTTARRLPIVPRSTAHPCAHGYNGAILSS